MQRIYWIVSSNAIYFLILLSAFTWLGGILVLQLRPPDLTLGETASWWATSLNLIHGHGYSLCIRYYFPFCSPANQLTAAREPLPVLLFGGVAMLFKDSLLAAGIAELFLHVGVLITLFFLTRELAGPLAGLIASLAWAVYPEAIGLISQVSGDLLAALGVTFGVLFILRARNSDRVRDWLLGGIGLGIAALSRSATLAISCIIIPGLVVERWRLKSRNLGSLYPALWVGLGAAALITPWLIRNDLVFHQPVLGSTLVGYNVYRQNYILGQGNYFHYVGTTEGWQAIQALIAHRTDLLGTENEARMNQVYLQEGLKVIAQHPAAYLLLSVFRFLPLWLDWGVSAAFGYPPGVLGYAMMAVQTLLLVFALLGLRRNLPRAWPLWAGIAALSAAYMAVDSRMLYIVCVMPLVISLSVAGGKDLLKWKFIGDKPVNTPAERTHLRAEKKARHLRQQILL